MPSTEGDLRAVLAPYCTRHTLPSDLLAALAAADEPLRELDPELSPRSVDEWREWLDALGRAVGEP